MKKILMTLAAVLCCTISNTVLTSCSSETKYNTTYSYEVEQEKSLADMLGSNYYKADEASTVLAAFNSAIGANGVMYNMLDHIMDTEMKSACAQVQSTYASSVQSIYMKFNLWRNSYTSDPDGKNTKELIASYEMGKALNSPYVEYSVETSSDDSFAALEAKKSELSDSIYDSCSKSLRYLLGRVSTSGSITSYSTSVYQAKLMSQDVVDYPYPDTEENAQKVREWCDLITSTLNPLTLAVPATVTVVKTGVINEQKTVVWTKTFQPNI